MSRALHFIHLQWNWKRCLIFLFVVIQSFMLI